MMKRETTACPRCRMVQAILQMGTDDAARLAATLQAEVNEAGECFAAEANCPKCRAIDAIGWMDDELLEVFALRESMVTA